MGVANGRQRYIVTSSHIGCAHTHNEYWWGKTKQKQLYCLHESQNKYSSEHVFNDCLSNNPDSVSSEGIRTATLHTFWQLWTPCVGSTNHTTYRVYHFLFISSRRDHNQNNVWMIIIIHCSVSLTCNAMVTSYCLVLYICICVVKNGSNFPSEAFMFIHYISSVGEKLAWFIRHLSDGLYIFHINLWNLPSDISAWPSEMSDVFHVFCLHCNITIPQLIFLW